ncbi:hypothetical protein HDU77_005841 [Chytriomyces hyalinus]|nr:hypothetical protein HDU77_005841 [Chytriomyces hyalinus]
MDRRASLSPTKAKKLTKTKAKKTAKKTRNEPGNPKESDLDNIDSEEDGNEDDDDYDIAADGTIINAAESDSDQSDSEDSASSGDHGSQDSQDEDEDGTRSGSDEAEESNSEEDDEEEKEEEDASDSDSKDSQDSQVIVEKAAKMNKENRKKRRKQRKPSQVPELVSLPPTRFTAKRTSIIPIGMNRFPKQPVIQKAALPQPTNPAELIPPAANAEVVPETSRSLSVPPVTRSSRNSFSPGSDSQRVRFGSSGVGSQRAKSSLATPRSLPETLPKYNRLPYRMTPISPGTHNPPPPSSSSSTTHMSTVKEENKTLANVFETSAGFKKARIGSETHSKNVQIGFKPHASNGQAFIPISQHTHHAVSQYPFHSRGHSRQGSGRNITSWQSHHRRMEYNDYVRSVSRQSAEEAIQRVKTAEEEAKKEAEAKLVPSMPDIETVVEEAQKTARVQTYQEYRQRMLAERMQRGIAEEREINVTNSENAITSNMEAEALDEKTAENSPLKPLSQSGRLSFVLHPNSAEDDTERGGAASTSLETPPATFKSQTSQLSTFPRATPTTPQSRYRQPMSITEREAHAPTPGDIILGRRGSLHAIPTRTKLTESEMDLLTSTTGQFRGGNQRDPHARFLKRTLKGVKLSGPNLSIPTPISKTFYTAEKRVIDRAKNDFSSKHSKRIQNAQAMREHEWAVAKNKYTVEGGPETGILSGIGDEMDEAHHAIEEYQLRLLKVSNPAKYKRFMEREKAKSFLLGKYEVLEQLRIQIVSKTTSLRQYHEYFSDLSRENTELKRKYEDISHRVNTLISKTLEENETCNLDIVRVDRERKQQHQTLKQSFDEFEAQSEHDIGRLEFKADMTSKTVDRITEEIDKLMEFKSLKESNPTAIAGKIQIAIQEREDHYKSMSSHLDQIVADWKTDQADIEATWMVKVQALIDQMGDSLKVTVSSNPVDMYYQNARLRHEISIHKSQAAKAEHEITTLMLQRKTMSERQFTSRDKRRDVLKLKNLMTCTPDMEFEVKPRNLLVKEIGV